MLPKQRDRSAAAAVVAAAAAAVARQLGAQAGMATAVSGGGRISAALAPSQDDETVNMEGLAPPPACPGIALPSGSSAKSPTV